jgi:hypothetical protein
MARSASDMASAFVAARPASEWSASNATDKAASVTTTAPTVAATTAS